MHGPALTLNDFYFCGNRIIREKSESLHHVKIFLYTVLFNEHTYYTTVTTFTSSYTIKFTELNAMILTAQLVPHYAGLWRNNKNSTAKILLEPLVTISKQFAPAEISRYTIVTYVSKRLFALSFFFMCVIVTSYKTIACLQFAK